MSELVVDSGRRIAGMELGWSPALVFFGTDAAHEGRGAADSAIHYTCVGGHNMDVQSIEITSK